MLLSLVLGYVLSARLNINDSSFWVTIYTLMSNLYLKHLGCKACTLEIFPRHSAWVSKIPKFNVSNAELNPSNLFPVILSLGLLLWRDTTMATQKLSWWLTVQNFSPLSWQGAGSMAVCRETSCQRQHLEFLHLDSKACTRLWLDTSKPASIVTLPPTRPQLLTVPLHLGVTFFQTCGPFSKIFFWGGEDSVSLQP